ncbi:hypothetical protein BB558_007166 [Smittium angustum]|uniref:Tc1-like transposase DDE domain-containing protein n=1 Tax=Smittium angustum TaxID=133377 RepID=A0A2U1IVR8_SMIAN|nr:hypothetical protein BB558_007166 [Smittium angustum]
MDESNVNIFPRQTKGRSFIGTRAVNRLPNSKGPNVHMLGVLCNLGLDYFESKRGHHTKETCNDWCCELIRELLGKGVFQSSIVLVCNNASIHGDLKDLESVYTGLTCDIKAFIKREMSANHNIFLLGDPNRQMSMAEYGLVYIEDLIEQAQEVVTIEKANHFIEHAKSFHNMAILGKNMPVGQ